MRLPTVERFPSSRERRTANERFRGGDRGRLYGSVALSAVIHVLLVLAWPELTPSALETGRPSGASAQELVPLAPVHPPEDGLVAVPLPEEGESPPEEADEEGREALDDDATGGAATGRDRRSEALQRIAAATPGVLDRRPDPPTDPVPAEPVDPEGPDAEEREGEEVRIPGASSSLRGRLSEEERMRLERLSSVRPGLAFGSLSRWLVVQNPWAVREFMRRRFPWMSEAGARGSLSVSLWIDESGSVEWAEINRSSGDPDIDASALELFEEVIAFGPARERRRNVPTAAIFWLSW